jgi:hypothetical protein
MERIPNYDDLANRSGLLIQELAFMLCDINPDLYKEPSVGVFGCSLIDDAIAISPLAAKLISRKKIALIKSKYKELKDICWRDRYGKYVTKDEYIHPYAIVLESMNSKLIIPHLFIELVSKRYKIENSISIDKDSFSKKSVKDKSISENSEDNYKVKIALLAYMLAKSNNKLTSGNKVSASAIKREIVETAARMELKTYGISIIERDISAGLKIIEDENDIILNITK